MYLHVTELEKMIKLQEFETSQLDASNQKRKTWKKEAKSIYLSTLKMKFMLQISTKSL